MSQNALIIGSTGLIGGHLCHDLFKDSNYEKVCAINRRPSGYNDPKFTEYIVDFNGLEGLGGFPKIDHAFCCLGTTMKKAGSKDAFYQVDFDYVLSFGKLAKILGCPTFVLVSSMGADSSSSIFYNQVKGEIEEAIQAIGFETVHIVRPSLLLGNRGESRLGESIGQLVAKTFSFLIPKNYQAIEAEDVALFMKKRALSHQKGHHIHSSGEIQRQ